MQLPATPPAADPAPELVPCPEPHEMGGDAALRLFGRMGLSEVPLLLMLCPVLDGMCS